MMNRTAAWHRRRISSLRSFSFHEKRHRSRLLPQYESLEDRRLLSAGKPDLYFDPTAGEVTTDFGQHFSQGSVILPMVDGRFVVVGAMDSSASIGLLARYNRDGSPDLSFGSGGTLTLSNLSVGQTGAAFQADGKIAVTGSYAGDMVLARVNADGSLDTGFGVAGRVVLDLGGDDRGNGVVVQPDGKIVVGGTTNGSGQDDGFLARFLPEGSLDSTFGGGDGVAVTDFASGQSDVAWAVALEPSGKIVVAGGTYDLATGNPDLALAQYTSDGSLDGTFGTAGIVVIDSPATYDLFYNVAVQPDGKIVADGLSGPGGPDQQYDMVVARFLADGSLDSSFGSGGMVLTGVGFDDEAVGLALQPDGRIIAGGYTDHGNLGSWDFLVARYNTNGSLDATFGSGGLAVADFGTPNDFALGVAVQADGRILATGQSSSSGATNGKLPLLRLDGAVAPAELTDTINAVLSSGQTSVSISVTENTLDTWLTAIGGDGTEQNPGVAPNTTGTTIDLVITLEAGSYAGQSVSVPEGYRVVIAGGTDGPIVFVGASPAFTLTSGQVVLDGVTAINGTNAPTILVTGGTLTIRNSTIQESTGYAQSAIWITGGMVDLGTNTDPGGNAINVNGTGELIHNLTGNPVSVVGDSFTFNGAPLASSSLSGIVFADFNNDGEVDFGEQGLSGVPITLDGTDLLGNAVHIIQYTDTDGAYVFLNLQQGTYRITETQPNGYTQGINHVGTVCGSVVLDQFDLYLAGGLNALNFNYGERPGGTGAVIEGQTAGIGFWNNKNGQALIKALNGGVGHQLGDWLAVTFPHMFGAFSGPNDLTGKDNASMASFFQSRFVLKNQKLDAQVLAAALAVYVTNATLDSTAVATKYGFIVSGFGVGTATVNVGSNGDAFGLANNTVMTVMDLLLAADAQAVNGVLYNGNTVKRNKANNVFSAINQAGSI